ncbi:MAG TPA: AEC family transporter [Clostridia bacterium]|nr:AEC family transporter [Clostridia bacterium]
MVSYFIDTFVVLLPLFILMAGGWIMGAAFSIHEDTLTRILVDFFVPLLVFGSLYRSDITPSEMADLLGTVSFMVFALFGSAILYSRLTGIDIRGFAMPVIFMNSGFLGIPLMKLWSGESAMNIIIVFDQIQTLFIFTLGFFIVGGGFTLKGLRLSLFSPILWAVILGFSANLLNIVLPTVLIDTCSFAGDAAPPLAAFVVGCSLSSKKPYVDRHIIGGIILRMGVGLLIGLASVLIFDLQGLTKTVVIVASALPAAVFSYVLPSRYGAETGHAQNIVVITTILSVFTIPLTFALARMV